MIDRAIQALHKLGLAPVSETIADKNSYGFREGRSCADAIAASFSNLSKPNSATWVLEGDITGCFDNISHQWLRDNIPMEKRILNQWLQAGYVEMKKVYPTRKGTPQGGIASPTLANITLDGLEEVVKKSVPYRSRVNFVRYADDFIVTGKSKNLLENNVLPAIEDFLSTRGLNLSPEKTKITYIRNGFTFLGQSIRKRGRVLRITPSLESIKSVIQKVGIITKTYGSAPMVVLIRKINEVLRGWGNYHRHVVSSKVFNYVDEYVYQQLWRMICRRHPKKPKRWLYKKYWPCIDGKWNFTTVTKDRVSGKTKIYRVVKLKSIGIKRHLKIRAEANPYMKEYGKYFHDRKHKKEARLMKELSYRLMGKAKEQKN